MPGSSGAHSVKRTHMESRTETHAGGKKSAGGSVSASSADTKEKGGAWGLALLMCQSTASSSSSFFRLVCFPVFRINGASITSNFWQFSVKVAVAHYPIILEVDDCFLREQLNNLLVVPISITVCLLFLSILVGFSPYFTLSGLITSCIYLLLRYVLSDKSDSLFSMVIMLSPFISRMLIYIFLLLSIIIIF